MPLNKLSIGLKQLSITGWFYLLPLINILIRFFSNLFRSTFRFNRQIFLYCSPHPTIEYHVTYHLIHWSRQTPLCICVGGIYASTSGGLLLYCYKGRTWLHQRTLLSVIWSPRWYYGDVYNTGSLIRSTRACISAASKRFSRYVLIVLKTYSLWSVLCGLQLLPLECVDHGDHLYYVTVQNLI